MHGFVLSSEHIKGVFCKLLIERHPFLPQYKCFNSSNYRTDTAGHIYRNLEASFNIKGQKK